MLVEKASEPVHLVSRKVSSSIQYIITFLRTLIGGETSASSSYLSYRLRIRAVHVLEQISGLADALTIWHTSTTIPAARALVQAPV